MQVVGPLCTKQFAHFHLAINSLCAMCWYWHKRTTELVPANTQPWLWRLMRSSRSIVWDLSCVCTRFCECACVCLYTCVETYSLLVFSDNGLFACVWGDYSSCFHCKQGTKRHTVSCTISHESLFYFKVFFFFL